MPLVVFDGLSIRHSGLRSFIIDQGKDKLQMAQVFTALKGKVTVCLLLCMQALMFHKSKHKNNFGEHQHHAPYLYNKQDLENFVLGNVAKYKLIERISRMSDQALSHIFIQVFM